MDEKNINPANKNPQLVFSWKAPLRAYKKRGGKIFRFYLALSLLLSLIIFFLGDKILIVPILTLFFLFYVLTITPPPDVENKITVFGIESAGITLRWEVLSCFYFTKKFGFDVLTLISHAPFYYHAYLIIPDEDIKTKVINILSRHLMFLEKPQRSITDRMIELLSNLVPEDEDLPSASSLSQKQAPASL